jgi:hypothetical protein
MGFSGDDDSIGGEKPAGQHGQEYEPLDDASKGRRHLQVEL